MDVTDVSQNINKTVLYKNQRLFIEAEYIFTAYILRKIKGKVVRQAEIKDTKAPHSILIVPLADIKAVEE